MKRTWLAAPYQRSRAYSPAVITEVRFNTRFVELRKEFFGADYPASTLVTVAALNRPEMMVEIQAVAVVG